MGSINMGWTRCVTAFSSVLVCLTLACLPMMATADTPPPADVVTEQAQEQEQVMTDGNAEAWKAIQVCFDCHAMSEEDISRQARQPQKKHRKAMTEQRPCTDCHNEKTVRCCHDNLFPKID